MRAMTSRTTGIVAVVSLVACGGPRTGDEATEQVQTEQHGDTTIVRTMAGSRWDAPRQLVIDLEIGTLDGPEETMFGRVGALAVDGSGGVYVYDGQAPAIRYFDAQGDFVRQVGGEGEGPGEYKDAVLGMAVRSDGRLEIRDARNGRVTLYDPDGSFSDQWLVASGLFTSQAMFVDRHDHTYLKILQEQPRQGENWKIGLLHYDPDGNLVDTVPDPWVPDPPPANGGSLSPSKQWTMGPDGSIIVGVNSSYSFEVRQPDGTVLRVERSVPLQPVSDAEHAAYEELREYLIREQGQFMTTLPGPTAHTKPAYRGLFPGEDGTVWVRLYGPVHPKPDYVPAEEGERPVWPFIEESRFDVFASDGSYLGEVRVPAGVSIAVFGLDDLWGTRRGDLSESYVVRMHLEPLTTVADEG